MKRLPEVTFGLFLLAIAVTACTTAAPVTAPTAVYVSDFELEAAQMPQSGAGGVPQPAPLPQRLGYGRPGVRSRTPEQQARNLVDLMSRALLDDLRQAGIPAQQLPAGAPLPSSGWLVRGAFLGVDAGGRLRRTVEFGAGSMQQVIAAVDHLRAGAPQPLYTIDSAAASGKFPGAVVTLNPTLVLGRFVLTPRDLDRNVRETAAEIVDQVKMRLAAGTPPTSETR